MKDGVSREYLLLRLAGLPATARGESVRGVRIDADEFRSFREGGPYNAEQIRGNIDGLWLAVALLEERIREHELPHGEGSDGTTNG